MKTEFKKSFFLMLGLGVCGITAGMLNALIGTGGGIILTLVLSKLYSKNRSYSTKDVFSAVLLSVSIMSAGTVVIYFASGMLDFSDAIVFLPSAAAGGAVGALLLEKLDSVIFKKMFALLVIWAGVSVMAR